MYLRAYIRIHIHHYMHVFWYKCSYTHTHPIHAGMRTRERILTFITPSAAVKCALAAQPRHVHALALMARLAFASTHVLPSSSPTITTTPLSVESDAQRHDVNPKRDIVNEFIDTIASSN